MAGRHRRTPAWRRLLLRLRRSDRAARTAALQAEVVALRATVRALRAELDAVWDTAARTADAARWELPLVQAALAPAEVAETRTAAAATPALAGVRTIALDLRPDTATTEIVLVDKPRLVLPESALLDAKQARAAEIDAAVIEVSEPVTAAAADTILPERRTA